MSKEANYREAFNAMLDNLICNEYTIQAQSEYVVYFSTPENPHPEKRGKWIFREEEFLYAENICREAIADGIAKQAKHTYDDCRTLCMFYLDCDDMEGHKRMIKFLRDNGLPERLADGRLANISFKLDSQTRAGEYGKKFKPVLRLSDFIDIYTEEWKEPK